MKIRTLRQLMTVAATLLIPTLLLAETSLSLISYQGQLKRDGIPVSGPVDMVFSLWTGESGGAQIGSNQVLNAVPLTNGLFQVELDFGSTIYDGAIRWLQVQADGILLEPRQKLTPIPHSLSTRGIFVDEQNNVGIGTATPNAKLDVQGGSINVGNAGDQATILGIGIERSWALKQQGSGSNTALKLQSIGGGGNKNFFIETGGRVGIGTFAPGAKLSVDGGSDASPAGGGYIQAGPTNGPNVVIDENEIMARNNGGVSNLHINNNGGDIIFGGNIDIGYEIVLVVDNGCCTNAPCPVGKRVIGGGCRGSGTKSIWSSNPCMVGTISLWRCGFA